MHLEKVIFFLLLTLTVALATIVYLKLYYRTVALVTIVDFGLLYHNVILDDTGALLRVKVEYNHCNIWYISPE